MGGTVSPGSKNPDTKTALVLFVALVIVVIYCMCLLMIVIRRAKRLIELYNRRYYLVILFYVASKVILSVILGVNIIIGFPQNEDNLSIESV